MAIDLHLHSTASDGALTPAQLVDYAVDLQLECIALTDHNTLRGLSEAAGQALRQKIRFIPGIELTSLFEGEELHLLGYFFDPANEILWARCKRHRQRALLRLEALVGKLQPLGIQVSLEEVLAIAGNSLPGRPHLARAMVAKGYVATIGEAFDQWLGNSGPVFVPVESETPEELYGLIHEAGGIAGVAHPGVPGRGEMIREEEMARHRAWGADLIEVYHPGHDQPMIDYYLDLAKKLKMGVTGGSDYHGSAGNAYGMAQKPCPSWVERELRKYYKDKGR